MSCNKYDIVKYDDNGKVCHYSVGETFEGLTIVLTDANDNPIDLTGGSVSMVAKKDYNGREVFDFNATISDALSGEITVPVFDFDYPSFNYIYDLFVTINGVTEKYLSGDLKIKNSVSK